MGFSFDTESGHLRELFGTEVLAEENNLADFWGSFQDLIFKIIIANYLEKCRLFLYHFSTL